MANKTVTVSRTPLVDPEILLTGTWSIFKENWTRYIFLSVLPYLSIVPFVFLAALFFVGGVFLYNAENYVGIVVLGTVGILITILYFSITFSIGSIALMYLIHSRGDMSIKKSLKKGWEMLWQYWYVMFLSNIIIIGGYLFFIIPGIIFTVWFLFAQYALVIDGTKGMDALQKSREYVRGSWLGVLGRFLLITILVYLVCYVPSFLFQILGGDALASLSQIIISLAVAPLAVIYMLLFYEDLKKQKPEVSSMQKKKNWMYLVITAIGFIVFFALMYFAIQIAVQTFQEMQYNQHFQTPEFEDLPTVT